MGDEMATAKSEPRRDEMDWAALGKSLEEKERARVIADRQNARKWRAVIVAVLVLSIVSLLGYFAYLQQISLVLEVFTLAAVGLGGFGGGYGFARWRGRR